LFVDRIETVKVASVNDFGRDVRLFLPDLGVNFEKNP